jgi:hypothetical protein
VEIVGYITTGIVLLFLCGWGIAVMSSLFQGRKKGPRLAGTVIPELGEGLDINKRYDIVYSGGDYGSHLVERLQNIRIIGYVGKADDEAVGKMYMQSRWLVIEFPDGRRAYLMPHAIISLQEAEKPLIDADLH